MGELMAGNGKKVAAALAAVGLYLEQEEAIVTAEQKEVFEEQGIPAFSQWSHTGRQEMMTMRRLTQLRTFTRF